MDSNNILILIPKRTNRVIYILNHFFKEFMGIETKFCTDEQKFKVYEGFKMHYGYFSLEEEFFIAADSLLFERGIQDMEINTGEYNGLPSLFQTYSRQSKFPFDIFAASFYLITRYEEYLPFIKDKYGRYVATDSIAFQNGFLQKPIIDIWAIELQKELQKFYPEMIFENTEYKFIPSIDIDAAFSYKHKGALRTLGGYAKSLRNLDYYEIKRRTKVIFNKERDPFDTFDYIFDLHAKFGLKAIFFILFADYGTNDKNTPTYNRHFKDLVAYIADNANIGIHPSFTSNIVPSKLKKEVRNLSKTVHIDINKSRQHFLILHLPSAYRNLIKLEITDDYSMGYASEYGFRASTSHSFLFYDLEMEYTTSLRIHPFAAMEGTLKDYKKMSVEEAKLTFEQIIDEIKAVSGTFISLWHNESLSDIDRWVGWRKLYEEMIEYALPNEKAKG